MRRASRFPRRGRGARRERLGEHAAAALSDQRHPLTTAAASSSTCCSSCAHATSEHAALMPMPARRVRYPAARSHVVRIRATRLRRSSRGSAEPVGHRHGERPPDATPRCGSTRAPRAGTSPPARSEGRQPIDAHRRRTHAAAGVRGSYRRWSTNQSPISASFSCARLEMQWSPSANSVNVFCVAGGPVVEPACSIDHEDAVRRAVNDVKRAREPFENLRRELELVDHRPCIVGVGTTGELLQPVDVARVAIEDLGRTVGATVDAARLTRGSRGGDMRRKPASCAVAPEPNCSRRSWPSERRIDEGADRRHRVRVEVQAAEQPSLALAGSVDQKGGQATLGEIAGSDLELLTPRVDPTQDDHRRRRVDRVRLDQPARQQASLPRNTRHGDRPAGEALRPVRRRPASRRRCRACEDRSRGAGPDRSASTPPHAGSRSERSSDGSGRAPARLARGSEPPAASRSSSSRRSFGHRMEFDRVRIAHPIGDEPLDRHGPLAGSSCPGGSRNDSRHERRSIATRSDDPITRSSRQPTRRSPLPTCGTVRLGA